MRYTVHKVLSADMSEIESEVLFDSDNGDDAEEFALEEAIYWYFGTAIIDHVAKNVDFGSQISPLSDVKVIGT